MLKSKKNEFARIFKSSIIIALSVVTLFLFTGCQTVDKSDALFIGDSFQYEFTYDKVNDITLTKWYCKIRNNTVFNIKKAAFEFKLFENGKYIRISDKAEYTVLIKHGDFRGMWFNVNIKGKIDAMELHEWRCDYSGIWETYKLWIILSACIAGAVMVLFGILYLLLKLMKFLYWLEY